MVQHMNVPALKKQWVLDAQWTDCPYDVEQVIKDLWRRCELGNDNYMLRRSIDNLLEWFGEEGLFEAERYSEKGWIKTKVSVLPLIEYLRSHGISDDEEVIIHWWW